MQARKAPVAEKAKAKEEEPDAEEVPDAEAAEDSGSEQSGEEGESERCCQSTALSARYCLSKKELEKLSFTNRPNPHHRSGPPMKLYEREEVKALALSRWGSNAGIRAEAARREAKAAKAAATRVFNDGWRNLPRVWSIPLHRTFSDPFKQSVRAFLLCLARKLPTNEYIVLGELVIKRMVEDVPTLPKHAKPKQQRRGGGGGHHRYYGGDYYDEMLGGEDW